MWKLEFVISAWFAAVMTGQTVAAFLIDHFGLLGNPKSAASPLRLLGVGLLIAGVFVIVQAKHLEGRSAGKNVGQEIEDEPAGPIS